MITIFVVKTDAYFTYTSTIARSSNIPKNFSHCCRKALEVIYWVLDLE